MMNKLIALVVAAVLFVGLSISFDTKQVEADSPVGTYVQITSSGYASDRIVFAFITRPDGIVDEYGIGVFADGHIEYSYLPLMPGIYTIEHYQRIRLRGPIRLELKGTGSFLVY